MILNSCICAAHLDYIVQAFLLHFLKMSLNSKILINGSYPTLKILKKQRQETLLYMIFSLSFQSYIIAVGLEAQQQNDIQHLNASVHSTSSALWAFSLVQ